MKKEDNLYEYIQIKLLESCGKEGKCMSYSQLASSLIYIRIPKMMIPKIIKELEEKRILNRVSDLKFEINGNNKSKD